MKSMLLMFSLRAVTLVGNNDELSKLMQKKIFNR